MTDSSTIYVLDYGAGNVRSLMNAIAHLGYTDIKTIASTSDFKLAQKLIFPGVGNFSKTVEKLKELGYYEPLQEYLNSNKKFLGICVGMQCLFASSEEGSENGLNIFDGVVTKFTSSTKSVPHIGWNYVALNQPTVSLDVNKSYYFVHSYAVKVDNVHNTANYIQSTCTYADETFVASVCRGNLLGCQFHPEKSGEAGLRLLKTFLDDTYTQRPSTTQTSILNHKQQLTKRIVACLDVRSDDNGNLVVTKGDQYDVRDKDTNQVRNLGHPVHIAQKYYQQGADEVAFLNITSYRACLLHDLPTLKVLEEASKSIFVPMTVGGGIRDFVQPDNSIIQAVDVAGVYFRAGADKVSIGGDAVIHAENYYKNGQVLTGLSPIETISTKYGNQAVVVSIDPKRNYTDQPSHPIHTIIKTEQPGSNGEQYCWFQCTIKGGREARDLDVVRLIHACQAMGAGEFMVNSIDKDGTNSGYDLELINLVKQHAKIPVIASSGAGNSTHFQQLFDIPSPPEAALAAGIFHRDELPIPKLKLELREKGIDVRV